MRALTIEEIKQLKEGDWIWLIDNDKQSSEYAQVDIIANFIYIQNRFPTYYFKVPSGIKAFMLDKYNTDWLAYRNKEEAECEGELVELVCNVGDTVYVICDNQIIKAEIDSVLIMDSDTYYEWKSERDDVDYECEYIDYNDYNRGTFTETQLIVGEYIFFNYEEAEQKLKELQDANH